MGSRILRCHERVEPPLHTGLCCDAPGWKCDGDFAQLLQAMETEPKFERRYRLWQDIHRLFWDRIPFIQHGDMGGRSFWQAQVFKGR
jgi:hypothetical protein